MAKTTLPITGMHCASCAAIIKDSLDELDGVTSAKVNYETGKATVEFDTGKVAEEKIKAEIQKLGYKVVSDKEPTQKEGKEKKGLKKLFSFS